MQGCMQVEVICRHANRVILPAVAGRGAEGQRHKDGLQ